MVSLYWFQPRFCFRASPVRISEYESQVIACVRLILILDLVADLQSPRGCPDVAAHDTAVNPEPNPQILVGGRVAPAIQAGAIGEPRAVDDFNGAKVFLRCFAQFSMAAAELAETVVLTSVPI